MALLQQHYQYYQFQYQFRGNHLSNATCLTPTQVFFNSGEPCGRLQGSLTRRRAHRTDEAVLDKQRQTSSATQSKLVKSHGCLSLPTACLFMGSTRSGEKCQSPQISAILCRTSTKIAQRNVEVPAREIPSFEQSLIRRSEACFRIYLTTQSFARSPRENNFRSFFRSFYPLGVVVRFRSVVADHICRRRCATAREILLRGAASDL